ncbi:hypothetical protein GCM10011374_03100 [Kocuria dechangensis]|uniref:Uncharacterized protein n=1 Tax=Kocuria dechangensis TaxID=1176249 RepID=A0A917GFX2_9MICC|nr:hypothetical protein [Kocuria dechangensis]GGG44156.1 hypothetical protein GCM10011374_03100 [Kocuria dechangensis]
MTPTEGPGSEERELRLHRASSRQGRELLAGGIDRATALDRLRAQAPGFDEDRYETALDEAVAQLGRLRQWSLRRRAQDIAEARQHDVLNAVCALHYINRRYGRQYLADGIGPIEIHRVLGDLWSAEDVDEAIARSEELIQDGWQYAPEPGAYEEQYSELAAAHPGFNLHNINRALDWGHTMNR